jgi:hypothetical protein
MAFNIGGIELPKSTGSYKVKLNNETTNITKFNVIYGGNTYTVWRAGIPYHVNFPDHPAGTKFTLSTIHEGVDYKNYGTYNYGTNEPYGDNYPYGFFIISVIKKSDTGDWQPRGHGTVTLPTQDCNKVKIEYQIFTIGPASTIINGENVSPTAEEGYVERDGTLTFDCTGSEFILDLYVCSDSEAYASEIRIKDIYFYTE